MADLNEISITSRDLRPSQRLALRRVVRYLRQKVAYSGCTSVRFAMHQHEGRRTVYVNLRTRRSDCEQYSPRQVMCEETVHVAIGPKGGITVLSANSGLGMDSTKHVAYMLGGKTLRRPRFLGNVAKIRKAFDSLAGQMNREDRQDPANYSLSAVESRLAANHPNHTIPRATIRTQFYRLRKATVEAAGYPL